VLKNISAAKITGLLLGITFIGIALYLFLFPEAAPAVARKDLNHYVLLTGSYGIWRIIRVSMTWKNAQSL